jgi:hypothetical protein
VNVLRFTGHQDEHVRDHGAGMASVVTFLSGSASPAGAAVGLLGWTPRIDQPFDLTAIEEDPATIVALVDQHPVPLVGAHLALTLGAN